ncbi:MAG: single-stranded-DNA-specific exonuclease RecJ [Planctomycetaceae bacterium]
MPRHWRYAPHDSALIGGLTRELGCSPLLAQVLLSRGVNNGAEAKLYLSAQLKDLHEPEELPGASEAADRVVAAIRSQRRITIYGDYDVDGVTATSILWYCLKLAGATVDYYIPSRLEEGYGLNSEAIRTLHEEDPERLVVTVDCGVSAIEQAALAKELGLELVITDHHTIGDVLPDACIMHPRLPGGTYPFGDLCGAGVAFKLAWAICQRLGDGKKASPRMKEFLLTAIGLAAVGTVADVVPLVRENRILVANGLQSLANRATLGMKALMKVAGIEEGKVLTAEDIGFAIGPRINAAGRLGQARLAVELLTTDNATRAAQLAEYVDQLNKNRQTVERRIFKEAKEQVESNGWEDRAALVLASGEWHPGVIGIVASRIAEHFEKPTVLIALNDTEGTGQGSGRSFNGFDLYSALASCQEHLLGFGGHRAAAGVRVDVERLEQFRVALHEYAATQQDADEGDIVLPIDAEVTFADLHHKAVQELERLGPFGAEHRRPRFVANRVELVDPPKKMGGGDRHLSLKLKQGHKVLRAIAFGKGDWADEIAAATGSLSFCFSAGFNSYRGYESVELQLIDWQSQETPAPIGSTT